MTQSAIAISAKKTSDFPCPMAMVNTKSSFVVPETNGTNTILLFQHFFVFPPRNTVNRLYAVFVNPVFIPQSPAILTSRITTVLTAFVRVKLPQFLYFFTIPTLFSHIFSFKELTTKNPLRRGL